MDKEYLHWIQELKHKIYAAQLKASVAVNEEMILLYWDIGKSIIEKQTAFSWGSKVVEMLAADLKRELPDTKGFSRSNLFAMRQFCLFYKDSLIVYQPGGQSGNEIQEIGNEIVRQPAGQMENNSTDNKNELKNISQQ